MTRGSAAAGALAISLAIAGALSAQALGQVDVPPVTVTVPTLPVPPVPIPTPPPPPLPPTPVPPAPPPPAVVVPQVPTSPASPAATAPPAASVPTSPALPATGGSSSAEWSYAGARPSSGASPSRPGRVTGIHADRWRATPSGKHRRAATITYTLTAPARVRFLVRGPAPSCRVVARFAVRGRAGTNRLRFTGRIGRRRLEPGTYRLVARTGGGRPSRPVALVVGDGPATRPACSPAKEIVIAPAVFEPLTTAFRNAAPVTARRGGVLPAVRRPVQQVQQVQDALPEALPKPGIGRISDPDAIPAWLIGLGIPLAGVLGILLGASAVGYLRRRSAYY